MYDFNLISAQNLILPKPFSSSCSHTFSAVVYLDPRHKLRSRRITLAAGDITPTWNDKFMFPDVDDDFLVRRPHSCLVVELYCTSMFSWKKRRVGVANIRVDSLVKNADTCLAVNLRGRDGDFVGMVNVGLSTLSCVLPEFLAAGPADHRKLAPALKCCC
ncbi:hypothetical protein LINPERPRIM_LOCUS11649 [Linum perenne]